MCLGTTNVAAKNTIFKTNETVVKRFAKGNHTKRRGKKSIFFFCLSAGDSFWKIAVARRLPSFSSTTTKSSDSIGMIWISDSDSVNKLWSVNKKKVRSAKKRVSLSQAVIVL